MEMGETPHAAPDAAPYAVPDAAPDAAPWGLVLVRPSSGQMPGGSERMAIEGTQDELYVWSGSGYAMLSDGQWGPFVDEDYAMDLGAPGRLRTDVPGVGLHVCTMLPERGVPAWTVVFEPGGRRLRYFQFWQGDVTPGGLEEAHHSVVARLRAGRLELWDLEEALQEQDEEVD